MAAPTLRYQQMSLDFLASVVFECYLMKESGLLPAVMRSALFHLEAPPALLAQDRRLMGSNRAPPAAEAKWEATVVFSLEEGRVLIPGSGKHKSCG